jgi:hypothetical protein
MADLPPIVTLLTDFGEDDGYVGAMKGVILGIAPYARLVDITHQVAPQNIQQAASILSSVYKYYPAHTVHLVVVDPGVGSARRPIMLDTPAGRFVAPDNGVLTYIREQTDSWTAYILDRPEYWLPHPSHTFHGRDIFSPVVGHLATGVAPEKLGTRIESITRIQTPKLKIAPRTIQGEVVRIDHFGNALTNIRGLRWVGDDDTIEFLPPDVTDPPASPIRFKAGSTRVTFSWHALDGIKQTYGQVPVGQGLALIGSAGELEISVNQGRAQEKLSLREGDPVTLSIIGS